MKHQCFVLFLFMVAGLFFIRPAATAQNVPRDLSQVNVNNLTDAQVTELMQKAQASGLSDSQLVQQARDKGMTDDQARLLHQRIASLRANNASMVTDSTRQRRLNYVVNDTSAHEKPVKSKIFGADLFRNGNLSFEPNLNLATPVNYIVGPQDQLNINVYGSSLANWKLTVSPEGTINIPGAGLLSVAGKTIEQATAAIKSKLTANNYAVGRGTSVSVSLGNIRSIQVIMVGQLERPGTYTLPSLATAFNALYAAGGPNDKGSFRRIEIIRNNQIIKYLDIYDFLVKGDQKDNIALQDQDIIRVPTYRTRVELSGEVKIPGFFEVLPGEHLRDVIGFAGGFTDQAYTSRVQVIQISDQQYKLTDITESDYLNYIPLRGDRYVVGRISQRFVNRVTIRGAVFRPGDYELNKGLTLWGLIKKADGIKEDAFTGRGSITRLKPDHTPEELSFNVADILKGSTADVQLQREDVVTISSIFDLRDRYMVSIKGEVRRPGEFAYADSMTVSDLIIKAGGLSEGGSAKRIEVSRRVFDSDPASKNSIVAQVFSVDVNAELKTGNGDFILQPFDMISVYSLPGYEKQKTVRVEGEVLYPGYYTIQQTNEKISDIIRRAGGLTSSADPSGSSLRRNNSAVLGVDRSQADTATLLAENKARISYLRRLSQDSVSGDTAVLRNNYIGIDLSAILTRPGSAGDLIMESGDVLRVPKEQQIVRVNGQVLYPSAVVYEDGKSLKDYILNAGGYASGALKRGVYVVYPNGAVRGTGKFLFFNTHPRVKPGSEIYVPKKPASKANQLQTLIALTTALASLGAIILGVISLQR